VVTAAALCMCVIEVGVRTGSPLVEGGEGGRGLVFCGCDGDGRDAGTRRLVTGPGCLRIFSATATATCDILFYFLPSSSSLSSLLFCFVSTRSFDKADLPIGYIE